MKKLCGARGPEICAFLGFHVFKFSSLWVQGMPGKARFATPFGVIEVAAMRDLRRHIRIALRRYGQMTTREVADFLYWGRGPRSRLGMRWTASNPQKSATRRALARARRNGDVIVVGKSGRWNVYSLRQRDVRP